MKYTVCQIVLSAMKKRQQRRIEKQVGYCGRGGAAFSNSMSKEDLSDKMTLEQRIVGAEGGNHVDIWENQTFTGHSVQRP